MLTPSISSRALVAAAVLLAACDSTAAPSLAISAPPGALELLQGESTSLILTVTTVNVEGDITFTASGLPVGVTATVTKATDGSASYAVRLVAADAAASGSSTVSITASATGTSNATTTFPLKVSVRGSYGLAGPDSAEAIFNATPAEVPIAIERIDGFAQDLTFSTFALPAGVEATFVRSTVQGGEGMNVILKPNASVPRGSYQFWIVATSPALPEVRHELTLTVTDPIILTFTTPDPAPGCEPTICGVNGTTCTPAITVTATDRGFPVKAEWVSIPFRVQYPGDEYADSLSAAQAVEFWKSTEIQPGETMTSNGWGFSFPKPYTITMRFRYRIIPGFAVRTDSVVTHCI